MLIEQAFFSLPEVLHGTGYQSQSYEYGIVSVLILSLLKVLNGRNAPNPKRLPAKRATVPHRRSIATNHGH